MISVAKVRAVVPAAASITDDTVIDDMIARAVAFVETYTRRYFGLPETVTESIFGNGSYHLRLSEKALPGDSDDPGISTRERMYPWSDQALVDSADYEIRDAETVTLLYRVSGAVWGQCYEYLVTYVRGYEVDDGPKDIEQVIIDLISLRLNRRGREGLGSETIGGYSYEIIAFAAADLASIPGATVILNSWRRTVLV